MLNEFRYNTFLELADYYDDSESNDSMSLLESSQKMFESANDLFNDIFAYYDNNDKLITEAGRLKGVLSKSKSAVGKVIKGCKKLADYLKSKVIDKAISLTKNPTYQYIKANTKYDIKQAKKKFKGTFEWLKKKFAEFKKMNTYKKAVVPASMVLGWVPPFTPIPGVTEVMIALSSIGDFLLDYKRGFLNQEYSAITEFSDYIQGKMDKLDETTILASDKLMQKALNYVNALQDEIKRLFLVITNATSKGVGKAADKLGKSASKLEDKGKGRKLSNAIEKTKKVADTVNKNSSGALNKYKDYKLKRSEAKLNAGGGKSLSKSDVKRLNKNKEALA